MSLTYSQKQFVQKSYPDKTVEEIASELKVSARSVEKHINKNTHLFKKKNDTEDHKEGDIQLFSFSNIKAWFKANWINLLTLSIFVLVAYINAFRAEFVSDDIQVLVELEDQIKNPSYIFHNPAFFARSILYYISYSLWGMQPLAFRIWNFLFHIGNVWLVYAITPYFFRKQLTAFIAATLVALHPMMIESVTWISGGIYAQAAFFTLFSFLLYLRSREKNSIIGYSGSIISFILALSVSEKIIIFPFIILSYEIILGNVKKHWVKAIGYFGTSTFWGLFVIIGRITDRVEYLQRTNGTAQAVQFYNPLIQIPVAIAKYFQLYFWPFGNTLYHSEFRMDLAKYSAVMALFIILLVIYFIAYKKSKKIFFLLTFFGISLLPTMNPFGLSWIVAERYAYFGSTALFIVIAYFLNKLIESKSYKTIGYILLTVLILGLAVRTLWRNSEWQNVDTLWVATGKTSPSDPKTHNNLGDMYARHGEMEKAVEAFSEAIRLNPNYAAAWYNRGNTYKHMKNDEEALKNFQVAVEKDPTIWQGYMNIAVIQFSRQEFDNAEMNLKKALELNPENPSLYANLGVVYLTKGNEELALQYLNKALEIDPQNAFAQEWLQKAQAVQ